VLSVFINPLFHHQNSIITAALHVGMFLFPSNEPNYNGYVSFWAAPTDICYDSRCVIDQQSAKFVEVGKLFDAYSVPRALFSFGCIERSLIWSCAASHQQSLHPQKIKIKYAAKKNEK
jgi:hypothetical protein